jgi:hypothetical protein
MPADRPREAPASSQAAHSKKALGNKGYAGAGLRAYS